MPLPTQIPLTMPPFTHRTTLRRLGLWSCVASLLAACSTGPSSPPPAPKAPEPTAQTGAVPKVPSHPGSYAGTPRDYRRDAATHLYAKNSGRIFSGKLPPQLYAIGVLQVDINARGAVTALRWMRAPTHAPEVVAEIERAVHQAAPFPAPIKMGKVTYTDTWLWHKSGQFQLDTLTEGQL